MRFSIIDVGSFLMRVLHTRRTLWCTKSCKNQFRGCKCPSNKCGATCICRQAGRDCDPEMCGRMKRAGHGRKRTKHTCTNSQLLLGRVTHVSVKIGSFGLGTFATAKIAKDALIGEYVAEIIPRPTRDIDQAQGTINRHRGLNYMFDEILADGHLPVSVDAATVGNPTRYLNDPQHSVPENVEARPHIVAGASPLIW
ncbi:hypothetical protein C8Q78DRAFT_612696 [Trametes maxima]|nr:hypothetical protein C8Q78DRAFT_612696 [Trametes maxima]